MNPVLLKPQSEVGAQIVVHGRVHGTAKASVYQGMKPDLMPFVLESFARLSTAADIILVEGRQAPRGEPACERHCQYGVCARGGGAGRSHRRHRPWRRDREPCRHQSSDRRAQDAALIRGFLSTSFAAIRRCSPQE